MAFIEKLKNPLTRWGIFTLPAIICLGLGIASISPTGVYAQSSAAWKRDCTGAAGSESERCFVRQSVVVKGRTIMTGAFGKVGRDKTPMVSIQLPLATALKAGIRIGVDDGEVTKHDFDYCIQAGCLANIPLTDALLRALKAGNKFTVAWVSAEGKQAGLRFDLVGFTSAWNSLSN
jgi:invasion protein IalB